VRSGLAKGKKHDASTETLELPYMRVANVQDGHIDLTDVAMLEVASDDVERYSLVVGDVLMNEGGDYDKLGRGAVWEGAISPCLHQNHVFAVRLDDVAWAPWVSALTRTAYAKFYFMNNSKQSTNLASISQSNVKEWPVVLPPEDVRDRLLEQLSTELQRTDDLIEHVELELKALAELRSATITDAVLGRIDVRKHMNH
jgi:type I restriction enzyme S subunit